MSLPKIIWEGSVTTKTSGATIDNPKREEPVKMSKGKRAVLEMTSQIELRAVTRGTKNEIDAKNNIIAYKAPKPRNARRTT